MKFIISLLPKICGNLRQSADHLPPLLLLCLLGAATALAANTPSAAPPPFEKADPWFEGQAPVQVTLTVSHVDPGQSPVAIEISQFTMRGEKGSVCTQVVRPDLLSKDEKDDNHGNLFFENGTVVEQQPDGKTWVKYKCTREQFLEYLTYCYTGAGLFQGFAQAAVQDEKNAFFTSADTGSSVTYVPKKGIPDLAPLASLTVRKKKPLQWQEFVFRPLAFRGDKPVKYLMQFKFSYDSPDLNLYPRSPPVVSREIPNPLPSRMVYP